MGQPTTLPARSVLAPSSFTIGEGATPAVHSTVALGSIFPSATTPFSSTFSTSHSGLDLDAKLLKPPCCFSRQTFGKCRKNAFATLDQDDRALRRINSAKLAAQGDGGQLRHRCRELHTRGTSTDQDECHLPRSLVLIICAISRFVGAQNLGADGLGVGSGS